MSEQNVKRVDPSAPLESHEAAAPLLPIEGAIVKLESMEMTALARQVPRDHQAVLADVVKQLEAYPSFAKEAIYVKPVGKDSEGKMRYARGLSIRAAEAMYQAWGNCAISCPIIGDTDDHTDMMAVFVDYERCIKVTRPMRVSKWYTSKYKKKVRHPDDRFASVVLASASSRAIREVALRSMPPGLRAELYMRAEQIADNLMDVQGLVRLISAFSLLKVTVEMIQNLIGKDIKSFDQDDRTTLLGIYNEIKTGSSTIDEVFSLADEGNADSPTANAPKAGGATIKPGKENDRAQGGKRADQATQDAKSRTNRDTGQHGDESGTLGGSQAAKQTGSAFFGEEKANDGQADKLRQKIDDAKTDPDLQAEKDRQVRKPNETPQTTDGPEEAPE